MRINLSQVFVNLKGETLKNDEGKETTLGQVLSNIVLMPQAQKKGFRPLRAWELAQKFYKEPEIELDNSEVVQIKEILEGGEHGYTALISGQVLEMFAKAEKLSEAKKE